MVLAAIVTAIPIVVLPATSASAAPVLQPGFTLTSGGDLGLSGNVTNFVYLPGGKILGRQQDGLRRSRDDERQPDAGSSGPRCCSPGHLGWRSGSGRSRPGAGLRHAAASLYLLHNYCAGGTVNTATGVCSGTPMARLDRFIADNPSNPSNLSFNGTLLDGLPASSSTPGVPNDNSHTVGTVLVAPDGTLFVGNGDASSWSQVDDSAFGAQDITSPRGKIFHINPDGTAVASNPFYTGDPNSVQSKVFAYGFRNPFRFSLKPGTLSTLYVGDVGFNSNEEIDVAKGGENFGWPCFEGATSFHNEYWNTHPSCQNMNPATTTAPLWSYAHFNASGRRHHRRGLLHPGRRRLRPLRQRVLLR